jgi:hypothetical protein
MNILVEYAIKTGRFTNLLSDMPVFIPVVASGMAVKMYADRFSSKKHKFLQTDDLDITVFMRYRMSASRLIRSISTVYKRYDEACEDYVKYLNENNTTESFGSVLVKRCPGPGSTNSDLECPVNMLRKQGEPFFNRNVYAFKKYYVKSEVTGELRELMDVVVVYQPGITSEIVNRRVRFGFPVPKVKHLVQELTSMIQVDILGKSSFNKKRHPVTGKESLKGVKDLHRLQYILTLTRDKTFDKHRALVKHLLNIINKKSYSDETRSMRLSEVLLSWGSESWGSEKGK